ncbi:MAM and LDL-receptor class A domain-containing protein 1-like isoform X2 [Mercenaria mercenaria]|uniref:MAM and LDL-receptor class A domain-containing protein 1-like isoform X2 n=1 Tax=Mercenaria mercenaria TaxID=6596 RepID=UPI00234E8313|nr:MAM and LDL-receptor class A domain-containing protein 1-like isoform X2 [Mercenaria mercenaria]
MFNINTCDSNSFQCMILLLCATAVSNTPLDGYSSKAPTFGDSCVDGQYRCGSSQCIPESSLCDGVSDCENGTDEIICESASCGFDNGQMCGWSTLSSTPVPNESFIWQLVHGENFTSAKYSQRTDASQMSPRGWYARVATALGSFHATTSLYTGIIGRTGPQCKLKLSYYMAGPSVGSLIVYISVQGLEIQLWETTGGKEQSWLPAVVFIGAKQNVAVVIQARRGQQFLGVIAVDQLQFLDCKPPVAHQTCLSSQFVCRNRNCIDPKLQCNYADECGDGSDENVEICDKISNGRCSFTNEICSFWTNAVDDQFDWTLAKDSTPTLGTGPSFDHTTRTKSGGYVYIDGSPPRKLGDIAMLTSPTIRGTSKMCVIRLWYHMWGSEVGVLTLLKRVDYSRQGLIPMSSIQGNHGDDWMFAQFEMDSYVDTRDYKIVIQGDVGRGVHDNIAVDDISLSPECQLGGSIPGQPTPPSTTPGPCEFRMSKCHTGSKCYSDQEHCDFIDACGDNSDEVTCGTSCQFESSSMCGWENSAIDNCNFALVTAEKSPGPKTDHTYGSANGHYIYAQNDNSAGSRAILESNLYYTSNLLCQLTVWYNAFGFQGSVVTVDLKSSQQRKSLLNITTSTSKYWQKADVNVGQFHEFIFIIEVAFPKNAWGHMIAIDDIRFTNCAPNATTTCSWNELLCASRNQCIPRSRFCDRTVDCTDGSDEKGCHAHAGDCNFDSAYGLDSCVWKQRTDDDADWIQLTNRLNPYTGADADKSGSQRGRFLTINSATMRPGDVAAVQTDIFYYSTKFCYVRFYYYMYGSENIGPLKVYVYNIVDNVRTLMWSVRGSKGQKWQYANVLVYDKSAFRVIFEATAADTATSDIAIDDVTFTDGCSGKSSTRLACSHTEFYCYPRKKCFPLSFRCDGRRDCFDGTDEPSWCPTTTVNHETTFRTHVPQTIFATSRTLVSQTSYASSRTLVPQTSFATCPYGSFQCVYSKWCFPGVYYCDGATDCTDLSDETNDCRQCRAGFFFCRRRKQCLSDVTLCDGIDDCGDGSDESLCSHACEHPYLCRNGGTCISGSSPPFCQCSYGFHGTRCQYRFQSVSNPTPRFISGSPTEECLRVQFYCRPLNECLPLSWRCDGVIDCPDGSDEDVTASCTTNRYETTSRTLVPQASYITSRTYLPQTSSATCPYGAFQCVYSKWCIPGVYYCDGVPDCILDQSDERNDCRQCHVGFFFCRRRKQCLSDVTRCDGIDDCGDGSDESLCSHACDHPYFCQHGGTCISGSSPPFCECSYGFHGTRCQYTFQSGSNPTPRFISDWTSFVTRSKTAEISRIIPTKHSTFGTTLPAEFSTKPKTSPTVLSTKPKTSSTVLSTKPKTSPTVPSAKSSTSPTANITKSGTSPTALSASLKTVASNNSTMVPVVSCAHGQFWCGPSQCIPAILQCDGVPDCADKRDEGSNCTHCPVGFYFCMQQRKCLSNTTRCDGKEDCGDGTDESLCTPSCGNPYFSCQNGGTCITGSSPPMCSCTTGNQGNRCQLSLGKIQRPADTKNSGNWKIGVGVVLGIVALAVVAVGAFLIGKYKSHFFSFRAKREHKEGFSNKAFEGYGAGDKEGP